MLFRHILWYRNTFIISPSGLESSNFFPFGLDADPSCFSLSVHLLKFFDMRERVDLSDTHGSKFCLGASKLISDSALGLIPYLVTFELWVQWCCGEIRRRDFEAITYHPRCAFSSLEPSRWLHSPKSARNQAGRRPNRDELLPSVSTTRPCDGSQLARGWQCGHHSATGWSVRPWSFEGRDVGSCSTCPKCSGHQHRRPNTGNTHNLLLHSLRVLNSWKQQVWSLSLSSQLESAVLWRLRA